MDIEIVSPRKSDDGIVFYVSAKGEDTGLSVSGLERLMGYHSSGSLFDGRNQLLKDMVEGVPRKNIPESLKDSWGNVFTPRLKGIDGAKIVRAEAAADIIEYQAIEKGNKVAQASLRKFNRKGINTWIKEVTHFATEPIGLNDQLKDALREIIDEKLETVMGKASKWDNLEGITATVYPGMKALNEGLSKNDRLKLLTSSDLYTAQDWLNLKKLVVDRGTKLAFCRQAADTYLTMTGQRPPDKYELRETTQGLKSVRAGKGYKMIDFHILETAWESYLQHKDELAAKPKAKRGRPKKTA